MKSPGAQAAHVPVLTVHLEGGASERSLQFTHTFCVGRTSDCDVCINNEYVSRVHAEVFLENGGWWIRDLNSSNGIFIDGKRVERAPIADAVVVRLGIEGPEVSLEVESSHPVEEKSRFGSDTIIARYVDHYFGKSDQPAGEHTAYVRRAFAQVQVKERRRYTKVIAVLLILAVSAGGYAFYLYRQVQRQRALAKNIFFAMKSLDLEMANEQAVLEISPGGRDIIQKYESQRAEMEKNYDQYLSTLHVYDRKMSEQQRLELRIARIFGECELDMPPDFDKEITRYIGYWQSSGRFEKAIKTAKANGYIEPIYRDLLNQGLPPQFFYLALQESNFDPYISGPMTRKGIAKGMWQFVPETAMKYGLHIGPLVDLRRPDPSDERDQYEKATKAAARYLKDLYSTDAQASGLLVMACYNWGENQVLPLVRSMPANPRERNFWRLLSQHRDQIPQETYDYVFYIVSAAVIGENPRLFGFDFDDPLANINAQEPPIGE